jgi:hypothetical protein
LRFKAGRRCPPREKDNPTIRLVHRQARGAPIPAAANRHPHSVGVHLTPPLRLSVVASSHRACIVPSRRNGRGLNDWPRSAQKLLNGLISASSCRSIAVCRPRCSRSHRASTPQRASLTVSLGGKRRYTLPLHFSLQFRFAMDLEGVI